MGQACPSFVDVVGIRRLNEVTHECMQAIVHDLNKKMHPYLAHVRYELSKSSPYTVTVVYGEHFRYNPKGMIRPISEVPFKSLTIKRLRSNDETYYRVWVVSKDAPVWDEAELVNVKKVLTGHGLFEEATRPPPFARKARFRNVTHQPRREHYNAIYIQRAWRKYVSNPIYQLCIRRLRCEFSALAAREDTTS